MTTEQVRNDLKEIKYYHAHKKLLEQSFETTGANLFLQKLRKYNQAVCAASLKLHEVYVGLHINGYSQDALAEKWGVTRMYVYLLNKKLIEFFSKNIA